jgi:hypothetical protein
MEDKAASKILRLAVLSFSLAACAGEEKRYEDSTKLDPKLCESLIRAIGVESNRQVSLIALDADGKLLSGLFQEKEGCRVVRARPINEVYPIRLKKDSELLPPSVITIETWRGSPHTHSKCGGGACITYTHDH